MAVAATCLALQRQFLGSRNFWTNKISMYKVSGGQTLTGQSPWHTPGAPSPIQELGIKSPVCLPSDERRSLCSAHSFQPLPRCTARGCIRTTSGWMAGAFSPPAQVLHTRSVPYPWGSTRRASRRGLRHLSHGCMAGVSSAPTQVLHSSAPFHGTRTFWKSWPLGVLRRIWMLYEEGFLASI